MQPVHTPVEIRLQAMLDNSGRAAGLPLRGYTQGEAPKEEALNAKFSAISPCRKEENRKDLLPVDQTSTRQPEQFLGSMIYSFRSV